MGRNESNKPVHLPRVTKHPQSDKPITDLIDLLGRRWMLRVIWELRGGALNFRNLQEQCGGVSSSVLIQRLSELREAGIAELTPDGYRLTTDGSGLLDLYPPVKAWAERWAA